jgi:hypothetical protein
MPEATPPSPGQDWIPKPDPTALTTDQLRRENELLRASLEAKIEAVSRVIETRLAASDKAVELLQRTTTDEFPEYVEKKVERLQFLMEEKLAGMGREHDAEFDGLQRQYSEKVSGVQRQYAEKFEGVQKQLEALQRQFDTQFKERDARTDQFARDNKIAIDAALKAQQDAFNAQNTATALAAGKTEANFTKQIDNLVALNNTSNAGLESRITTLASGLESRINTLTASLESKIGDLKDRLTLIEGRGSGYASSWGIAVAVIGVLLGLAGFAIARGGP